MPDIETLNHTTWDCKYHVVFIPKYRRKALSHELRRHLGEVFRALAEQKACRIEEGHVMGDHSRAHAPLHSPEVLCGAGGGLYQGESGDPYCPDIYGTPQELYRAPFLGSGVLCLNRGQR